MNQTIVLEHRLATLDSLLNAPGGPLGPNAGHIADKLRDEWSQERQLLSRLLAESSQGDVRSTIATWRERTTAFVAKRGPEPATWRDLDGFLWNGPLVLRLLDETDERIERWLRASGPDPKSTDVGPTVDGDEASPPREQHRPDRPSRPSDMPTSTQES